MPGSTPWVRGRTLSPMVFPPSSDPGGLLERGLGLTDHAHLPMRRVASFCSETTNCERRAKIWDPAGGDDRRE